MLTLRGGQHQYKSFCSFSSACAQSCSPETSCFGVGLILPNLHEVGLVSTLGIMPYTSYKCPGKCPWVIEEGEQRDRQEG